MYMYIVYMLQAKICFAFRNASNHVYLFMEFRKKIKYFEIFFTSKSSAPSQLCILMYCKYEYIGCIHS